MLKLQHSGTAKSVWLVGPIMKLGAAKNSDLLITGEGVEDLHCQLHVEENKIVVQPMVKHNIFINNNPIAKNAELKLGDTLKIGENELEVIRPKQASSSSTPKDTAAAASHEASGWILQGIHPSIQNKRYPIDGKVVMGRSKDCDLHFSFERLSRRHAQLKIIDGNLLIEDLDSSNGTFHNGKRIKRATLNPGDSLALDKLEFTILGKKSVQDDSSTQRWDNSLNQTIVRSAITPEMIEKAGANKPAKNSAPTPNMIQPGNTSSSPNTMIIAGLVIVVAALAITAFLL